MACFVNKSFEPEMRRKTFSQTPCYIAAPHSRSVLHMASHSCDSDDKECICNAREEGLLAGWGRSPGEGKDYPFQYSGLENSVECIVPGVPKSRTRPSDFHFHFTRGSVHVNPNLPIYPTPTPCTPTLVHTSSCVYTCILSLLIGSSAPFF